MKINDILISVSVLRSQNADLMDRPHFKFMGEFDSVVAASMAINGNHPEAQATAALNAMLRNLESTIELCRKQDLKNSK